MNSPHYALLRTQTLGLAATNREWYTLLTSGLTPEQKEKIQKLFVTAEQRKAARGMYIITIMPTPYYVDDEDLLWFSSYQ